jgi:hypothetical protein
VGRPARSPDESRAKLKPVPATETCEDCGTALIHADEGSRCPACFDEHLYSLDAGFLDSYRKFGCRSRLVVAEACLRALVLESPDHRKVLAMTIFEQYVQAMNDLAGLFTAFLNRHQAPILKSFMEFRLDHKNAVTFFDAVRAVSDSELCRVLDLPLPIEVAGACPHLDEEEAYSVAVAIYHLALDLRKSTDEKGPGPLALAEVSSQIGSAVISPNADWLNGAGRALTPDQVAMMVLDSRKRAIHVQGLSAEEGSMAQVVDAIDTATRAASNLIFAYLQVNNL